MVDLAQCFGAAFGWLVGAGALLVPGLEAMHAAGPILGMLGGWASA